MVPQTKGGSKGGSGRIIHQICTTAPSESEAAVRMPVLPLPRYWGQLAEVSPGVQAPALGARGLRWLVGEGGSAAGLPFSPTRGL